MRKLERDLKGIPAARRWDTSEVLSTEPRPVFAFELEDREPDCQRGVQTLCPTMVGFGRIVGPIRITGSTRELACPVQNATYLFESLPVIGVPPPGERHLQTSAYANGD